MLIGHLAEQNQKLDKLIELLRQKYDVNRQPILTQVPVPDLDIEARHEKTKNTRKSRRADEGEMDKDRIAATAPRPFRCPHVEVVVPLRRKIRVQVERPMVIQPNSNATSRAVKSVSEQTKLVHPSVNAVESYCPASPSISRRDRLQSVPDHAHAEFSKPSAQSIPWLVGFGDIYFCLTEICKDRIVQCSRCRKTHHSCKFEGTSKGSLRLSCINCVRNKVKCEYQDRDRSRKGRPRH